MTLRYLLTTSLLTLPILSACDDAPPAPSRFDISYSLASLDPSIVGLRVRVEGVYIDDRPGEVTLDLLSDPASNPAVISLPVECDAQHRYEVTLIAWDGKPCPSPWWETTVEVSCEAGKTTPVVLAPPERVNAFIECAVPDFDGPICSAKIDGQETLLFDPEHTMRHPTSVVAMACTAGDGPELNVYATDAKVICGDSTATFPYASAHLGNFGPSAPYVIQAAKYAGVEAIGGESTFYKSYTNAAFAMDLEALVGRSCNVDFSVVMTTEPLVAGQIPDASIVAGAIAFSGEIIKNGEMLYGPRTDVDGAWRELDVSEIAGLTLAPVSLAPPEPTP